ncbi:MAG: hypothetical protein H0U70_06410 [Tatlockia sp.]|nr:hypothetical protein [Tatlockia sp.]
MTILSSRNESWVKLEEIILVHIPLSKVNTVKQIKNISAQHTRASKTGQVPAADQRANHVHESFSPKIKENKMHYYLNQWREVKQMKALSLKEKTKEIIILDRTAR